MTDTLYGAQVSLYSGKARAYLDWKGIDYREVLATPDVYRSVIIPNVGRPVIPVVETAAGDILQDTTLIIDHYEAASPAPGVYPDTPRQKLVALLLECFGDEWLTIPAMHYRWNYNEEWIYSEFGKLGRPDGSPEEQYQAGKANGQAFKGIVPLLGINEQTIPAIEASYEALLSDLNAHFAQHDFLLGSRPSIGDLGLIGPLYAHLFRDPVSGELMERLAPKVADWVRRMVDAKEPQSGAFLPDDAIPETLLPILKRMMAEQIPHLAGVSERLSGWMAQNEAAEPPRMIGTAAFEIEGVRGERMATPFSLWMLQRSLDYLATQSGADRDACEQLLHACDGAPFLKLELPCRLVFENHKLTIAGR